MFGVAILRIKRVNVDFIDLFLLVNVDYSIANKKSTVKAAKLMQELIICKANHKVENQVSNLFAKTRPYSFI